MDAPAAHTTQNDRAFPTHARPDRYFPAESVETARRRIEECLIRGDGPAVVIGAPGVGKTMLLEVTAAALRSRLRVVTLSGAQLCTRRALLQAILFGLELPYRQRAEGELRLSLHQSLLESAGVALLVDEAQALSPKLLEELRVVANLAQDGAPVVRPALFGGPSLEDLLATPEMETFSQRIAARCYLNPMSYEETREYVRAHANAVGVGAEQVFTNDALDAVFHGSDGIARLVSQLSDRSLAIAWRDGFEKVDAQVVQLAWSDLHQLPAPWNTPAEQQVQSPATVDSQQESSVEFGELEDAFEFEPSPAETPQITHSTPATPQVPQEIDKKPPEFIADRALSQVAEENCEGDDSATVIQADDPFGDGFDEEEIVIDRFAGIETVFHSATPRVTNGADPSLSALADSLVAASPQAESVALVEPVHEEDHYFDTELELEDYELVNDDAVDDEERSTIQITSTESTSCNDQEDDILVIENDLEEIEGTVRPMVRRREYRQLFSQLRHG